MNGAYLIILLNFTVLFHKGTSNIKQAYFKFQIQSTRPNGTFHAMLNSYFWKKFDLIVIK